MKKLITALAILGGLSGLVYAQSIVTLQTQTQYNRYQNIISQDNQEMQAALNSENQMANDPDTYVQAFVQKTPALMAMQINQVNQQINGV